MYDKPKIWEVDAKLCKISANICDIYAQIYNIYTRTRENMHILCIPADSLYIVNISCTHITLCLWWQRSDLLFLCILCIFSQHILCVCNWYTRVYLMGALYINDHREEKHHPWGREATNKRSTRHTGKGKQQTMTMMTMMITTRSDKTQATNNKQQIMPALP